MDHVEHLVMMILTLALVTLALNKRPSRILMILAIQAAWWPSRPTAIHDQIPTLHHLSGQR